jgi:hypothetical protein
MVRFIADEVRRVGGRWLALWPVAAKHRLRSQAAAGDAGGAGKPRKPRPENEQGEARPMDR